MHGGSAIGTFGVPLSAIAERYWLCEGHRAVGNLDMNGDLVLQAPKRLPVRHPSLAAPVKYPASNSISRSAANAIMSRGTPASGGFSTSVRWFISHDSGYRSCCVHGEKLRVKQAANFVVGGDLLTCQIAADYDGCPAQHILFETLDRESFGQRVPDLDGAGFGANQLLPKTLIGPLFGGKKFPQLCALIGLDR